MPDLDQVSNLNDFIHRLTLVGIPGAAAEALYKEQLQLFNQLATKKDFAQLEAGIVQLGEATKKDFARLEADIARLEAEAATKKDIARLEAEAATKKDFARLEADIARLEVEAATKKDIARLEADIARLEAEAATKKDIARLETNVAQLEATTKENFVQLEARLSKDTDNKLEKLELRMATQLEKMRSSLVLTLGSIVMGTATLLGAFFKFFPPISPAPAHPTSVISQAADSKKALETSVHHALPETDTLSQITA